MKKRIIYNLTALAVGALSFTACGLDEYNPSAGEASLDNPVVWKGLQANCYSTLYHELYSKADFLIFSEAGTDLWLNPAETSYAEEMFYYDGLGVARNEVKKVWQQAYAAIATCNTVINHAPDDTKDTKILVAEAKCIRALMHLTLTTYYGPITLSTAEVGINNNTPVRNSLQEVYSSIVQDLTEAIVNLEVEPYEGDYGRVSKKSAIGLLARTYAQGAGEGLIENGVSYWQRAKEVAEDAISNASAYGIYLFPNVDDLWAWGNNRGNKEFLMNAAGLDATLPDANMAGEYLNATSYTYAYTMCSPYNAAQDLYRVPKASDMFLGPYNQGAVFAPTEHAIDVYGDWDKRYENTYLTAYGQYSILGNNAWSDKNRSIILNSSKCGKYGIDKARFASDNDGFTAMYRGLFNLECGVCGNKVLRTKYLDKCPSCGSDFAYDTDAIDNNLCEAIPDTIHTYVQMKEVTRPGGVQNVVDGVRAIGNSSKLMPEVKNPFVVAQPLDTLEDRISIWISKNDLAPEERAKYRMAVINLSQLFDDNGDYTTEKISFGGSKTSMTSIHPSLLKYNWAFDGVTREAGGRVYRNGDIPVMRTAELYLIAAEAELALGNASAAAQYVQPLWDRAVRSGNAPKVTGVNEQFILDEYAREFAGEHMRWAVLKRHGALKSSLEKYNKKAASHWRDVNIWRPISQTFLDQILNANEYGDNGYDYNGVKGY